MARELLAQPESPPVGSWRFKLLTINAAKGDYGDVYDFLFEVVGGPHQGCVIVKRLDQKLKLGLGLANFLEQLDGKPLERWAKIDLDAFVGREFDLTIVPRGLSGLNVDIGSVSPVKA